MSFPLIDLVWSRHEEEPRYLIRTGRLAPLRRVAKLNYLIQDARMVVLQPAATPTLRDRSALARKYT